MTAIVAAICGAPGSGKSSVCRALAEAFRGELLSMDVDAAYTTMSPSELSDWIDAGADYNAFALPEVAEQLALKLSGDGHVFFESHFGRSHHETGQYITQQIYLQLPLELALARQLEGICTEFIESGIADLDQLRWFKGFLRSYQDTLAPLLVTQAGQLAARADLVVDANRPLDAVVADVVGYLRELK